MWVRKHSIAWGYGVVYLADGVQDINKLRALVEGLCRQDVATQAAIALRPASKLLKLIRPGVILAIAQTVVVQNDKIRGKKWKVMGLQLGNRIWITWCDADTRTYRSLLGHELGECLLSASGFKGSAADRHVVIARAGLDHRFVLKDQKRVVRPGVVIRKTVPVLED
jgi:hypothetical protein